MCSVLDHSVHDCVKAHLTSKPVGPELRQNLLPLESIYQSICQNLRSGQQSISGAESATLERDNLSSVEGHISSSPQANEHDHRAGIETEAKVTAEVQPITESVEEKTSPVCDIQTTDFCSLERKPASTIGTGGNVEMEEAEHTVDSGNAASGSSEKKGPPVIYLDD